MANKAHGLALLNRELRVLNPLITAVIAPISFESSMEYPINRKITPETIAPERKLTCQAPTSRNPKPVNSNNVDLFT